MNTKILLAAFTAGCLCIGSAAAESSSDDNDARVIVKFKASGDSTRQIQSANQTNAGRAPALANRLKLDLRDGRAIDDRTQLVRGRGLSSAQLAQRLATQPDVEYAVVDERRYAYSAPNDPLFPGGQAAATPAAGQWYLRAPDTTVVSATNAEGAWKLTTGANVVVAVLDTGVRFEHPDLAAKLLPGYDFIVNTTVANDGNARDADASDPGDWLTSADQSIPPFTPTNCGVTSSTWHGTQTAGLVGAAARNGIGMAGVGGDVMVLPLRVLGKCGGYDSDILAAMRWAVGLSVTGLPANPNPAKVINMSLGSGVACSSSYTSVITEIQNHNGVVIVAAAGNEGSGVGSPASCPGVIGVAGLRHSGTKVGYSSLGPEAAIAAPAGNCVNASGVCLYSLITTANNGGTSPQNSIYTDGLDASLGTSFSSPLVAGTVALMFSANPALTPAQVKTMLQTSARTFPSTGAGGGVSACHAPGGALQNGECYCTTSTCGAGMLDALGAVALAAGSSTPRFIAAISYDANQARVGNEFQLDSAATELPAGRTVSSYTWTLVSGPAGAHFTTATNAAVAKLQSSDAGKLVVRLSLVDDLSNTSTRDIPIVLDATLNGTTAAPAGDGGGGGGAVGSAWLAGLLAAILALQFLRRRELARNRKR